MDFFILRYRNHYGINKQFGGPNQSRTGDLSMPWTYDPNFTMGPFKELITQGFSLE